MKVAIDRNQLHCTESTAPPSERLTRERTRGRPTLEIEPCHTYLALNALCRLPSDEFCRILHVENRALNRTPLATPPSSSSSCSSSCSSSVMEERDDEASTTKSLHKEYWSLYWKEAFSSISVSSSDNGRLIDVMWHIFACAFPRRIVRCGRLNHIDTLTEAERELYLHCPDSSKLDEHIGWPNFEYLYCWCYRMFGFESEHSNAWRRLMERYAQYLCEQSIARNDSMRNQCNKREREKRRNNDLLLPLLMGDSHSVTQQQSLGAVPSVGAAPLMTRDEDDSSTALLFKCTLCNLTLPQMYAQDEQTCTSCHNLFNAIH